MQEEVEQKIISRDEAIELGLSKYFSGVPCKNGHVRERQTVYGNCLGCMAEANAKRTRRLKRKLEKARSAVA